jgi:hypothetical protein
MGDSTQELRKAILNIREKSFTSSHRRTRTTAEIDFRPPSVVSINKPTQGIQKMLNEGSKLLNRSNRSTFLEKQSMEHSGESSATQGPKPLISSKRTMLYRNKVLPNTDQSKQILEPETQSNNYARILTKNSFMGIQEFSSTADFKEKSNKHTKSFSKISEKKKAAETLLLGTSGFHNIRMITTSKRDLAERLEQKPPTSSCAYLPLVEFYDKLSQKSENDCYEKVIRKLCQKLQVITSENQHLRSELSRLSAVEVHLKREKVY